MTSELYLNWARLSTLDTPPLQREWRKWRNFLFVLYARAYGDIRSTKPRQPPGRLSGAGVLLW